MIIEFTALQLLSFMITLALHYPGMIQKEKKHVHFQLRLAVFDFFQHQLFLMRS